MNWNICVENSCENSSGKAELQASAPPPPPLFAIAVFCAVTACSGVCLGKSSEGCWENWHSPKTLPKFHECLLFRDGNLAWNLLPYPDANDSFRTSKCVGVFKAHIKIKTLIRLYILGYTLQYYVNINVLWFEDAFDLIKLYRICTPRLVLERDDFSFSFKGKKSIFANRKLCYFLFIYLFILH